MKKIYFLHLALAFVGSLLTPVVPGRRVPDNLKAFYNQVKVLSLIRRLFVELTMIF